jgi:hypothetical protein
VLEKEEQVAAAGNVARNGRKPFTWKNSDPPRDPSLAQKSDSGMDVIGGDETAPRPQLGEL